LLGQEPNRAFFGEMMKPSLPIAVLLMAVGFGGCASPCQYMRSTEEAEAHLETVRARKNALEQEIRSLRDLNDKLTANADSLLEDLQRAREGRGLEQKSSAGSITEPGQKILEQKIKDLTAQKRTLEEEYDEMKGQNRALKATVTRYRKDLKELQRIPSFTDADLRAYH
ncbi:MAG: hypothetical protein ACREJU_12845, partial [Nitrospiraceae bacterium]